MCRSRSLTCLHTNSGRSLSYPTDAYNRQTTDVVVVAMTSNPALVDYSFVITSSDLQQGQLNHPGTIRVDKLYTLSQAIVTKTFGRVTPQVLEPYPQRAARVGMSREQPDLTGFANE